MTRYYCHEHPDVLTIETRVVDARPGAVLLENTPFYPGGGGQVADHGRLSWTGGEVIVSGIDTSDGRVWHVLAEPIELSGVVQASVDPSFRDLMCQLHTDAHILNALVYQQFRGALVTGAQLNDDGTVRVDFDLPDADNDRLRASEPSRNDAKSGGPPVSYADLPAENATPSPAAPERRWRAAATTARPIVEIADRPPGRRHPTAVNGTVATRPHPQERTRAPQRPSLPRGARAIRPICFVWASSAAQRTEVRRGCLGPASQLDPSPRSSRFLRQASRLV